MSQFITNKMIANGTIEESKTDIYKYGFEILISTTIYLLIFVVVSIVSNTAFTSLIFAIGFFIVRFTAGGYHADTYVKCHLLSMFNHVFFVVVLKVTPVAWRTAISIVGLVLSISFILILAPIDHPNKPFIKNERKRFRMLSCIYCLVLMVILIFAIILQSQTDVLYSFSVGTFCAAFALTSAKIQKNKRSKNNEENPL